MSELLEPGATPGLLARVRHARAVEDQAARDTFLATAEFLAACTVSSVRDAAVLEVAESAVVEFTAALGYTPAGGRAFLADVAEVAWRLPKVWARILDGSLQVWRARRIAQVTRALSPEVAAYVDQHAAVKAHTIGSRQLERLAREGAALCEPDVAAVEAEEVVVEQHGFTVETDPLLFQTATLGAEQGDAAASVARVYGTLDAADAVDLERAVSTIAHDLLDHESTAGLPVEARRAAALGVLARAYNTGQMPTVPGAGRVVELRIHTDTPDLAGTGLVRKHDTRGLATLERLEYWSTMPGVTLKPVIVVDLNEGLHTDGYRPTPRQRRQAALIHETCAFPGCTVCAEDCDLDHRIPYDEGGSTTSSNLTPLCRKHHRAKTHLGWSYERLGPGVYLWHSPHGYRYLTSRDGTIDLAPDVGTRP